MKNFYVEIILYHMKVAVIGGGNVGSSLAKALKERYEVKVTSKSESTASRLRNMGLDVTTNREAIPWGDIVIVSVKPFHLPHLLRETQCMWRDKVVVSTVAGVDMETLRRHMNPREIYRAMPNLGITVRKSTTALTGEGQEWREVDGIFSMVGTTYWIEERLMDAWTALIGGGPGVVAELLDSFILAGVKSGLKPSTAKEAVLDMIRTTVELLKEGNPCELRDKVATPAGTTIEAISVLERRAVRGSIMEAIEESSKRSTEISREVKSSLDRV